MKRSGKRSVIVRRSILGLLLLISGFLLALISLAGCASLEMGRAPGPEEVRSFAGLDNYANGTFANREPATLRLKKGRPHRSVLGLFQRSPHAPSRELPAVALDRDSFAATPDDFSVRWLGHSSLVFELAGVRFVIDPVFGNAAPLPFAMQRYAPSPLAREDLPPLDFILISHDHYDHLEYATIRSLRDHDVPFIVPLGVGARLRGWGIGPERIHELNWNQDIVLDGIRITAQTARHFSGRTFRDRNTTLWNAYVIQGGGKSIFYGADGGYGTHFRQTGEAFGPFDLVCLEIDAWNDLWPNSHLFPEEVIQAHRDLGGGPLLPIHWGVFDLAMHPWDESIQRVAEHARASAVPLFTPKMGEKATPGLTTTQPWWESTNAAR
jgi:L-ascorbate metabolism protein UlaG (beta-lactamase superfamily)